MIIAGINSGVDFERYIQQSFINQGYQVFDTPASNDYGSDLIIHYGTIVFSIQCKYYDRPVGVKAVQEVMGSLSYYNANYGIVITNNTFTQQAVNLARTNSILLIGDAQLQNCLMYGYKQLLDYFIENNNSSSRRVQNDSEEWVLTDLQIRYGVNKETIIRDFMSRGMPYYKVGREYRFNPQAVISWEIDIQRINYGRNEILEMPAFRVYRNYLLAQYKEAKNNHDKELIKYLKDEMKSRGIKYRFV